MVTDDYIAVANRSTSGSSYVWDKATGRKVASSKLTGVGGGICATKAGQFFFAGTGENGFLPIWKDNSTGKFAVIPDINGAIGYGDVSANGVQPMVDSRGYLYVGSSSSAWCFDINGYDGSSKAPVVWSSKEVTGGQICKGAGFVMSADGLTIYAGSQGAEVFAVEASTGSRKWGVSLGAKVQTVPAIDNLGNIHVCDLGGGYTIVSPEGELLFSINLGDSAWASPAIADDGTVYVVSDTGIAAVRGEEASLISRISSVVGFVDFGSRLYFASGDVVTVVDKKTGAQSRIPVSKYGLGKVTSMTLTGSADRSLYIGLEGGAVARVAPCPRP